MKLLALLLAASLAGNAALLAFFRARPEASPPALRDFFTTDAARAAQTAEERRAVHARAAAAAKTAADRVAAARTQLWAALATDDLPALVARLRAAGFSPAVIRAVVNAQLERWFRARMKELAGDATDAPFWKPEPGLTGYRRLFEAQERVYRERTARIRELLGEDYFSRSYFDPTGEQRRQFGNLPPAKIALLQRIVDDYAEMTAQITAAAQGIMLPEDREKLALLEREKRADLAAILSPAELEDYLLRSSPFTSRNRAAFSLMHATEAEFLALYRINQPYLDLLFPSGSRAYGADTLRQRTEVQAKVAEQSKAALGEARYAEFVRASSSEYQQLVQLTLSQNLPADAAVRAYDTRDTATKESVRIHRDQTLSNDQKTAALKTLAQTATAQLVVALGPTAGPAYAKSASWLSTIANGGAIAYGRDGSTMTFRPLPPSSAAPLAPPRP